MAMRRSMLITLLITTAALAGCVGEDAPGTTDDPDTGDAGPGATGEGEGFTVTLLGDAPALTAGARASLPVEVADTRGEDATVVLTVTDSDAVTLAEPVTVDVPAGGATATVLTFTVEDDVTDDEVLLAVTGTRDGDDAGAARAAVAASAAAAGDAWMEDVYPLIVYAGFLVDGRLVFTNDPAYDEGPFPRVDAYEFDDTELLLAPGQGGIIDAIYQGIMDAREGEARPVHVAAADAFGDAVTTHEEPRRESVTREEEIPRQEQPEPYESFAQHVASTGQGNAEDFEVNDTFTRDVGPNVLRFRITAITPEEVTAVLAPEVGESFTLHPAWPGASEVTHVGDASFTLYTTPTTEPGEAFTYVDHWPDASVIEGMDDDVIVIRHSPEEGLEYEMAAGFGQPPQQRRVAAVQEDVILVEEANPHPFAGEDLVMHVRVLDLMDLDEAQAWQQEQMAQQQQQGQQPQPPPEG